MRIRIMLGAIVVICGAVVAAVMMWPSSHGSSAAPTATVTPSPSVSPSQVMPSAPTAEMSSVFDQVFKGLGSASPSR